MATSKLYVNHNFFRTDLFVKIEQNIKLQGKINVQCSSSEAVVLINKMEFVMGFKLKLIIKWKQIMKQNSI